MRRVIAFAAKAAISGLLLYLALDFVNFTTLRERFGQISFGWVAAGIVALALPVFLVAIRWHAIGQACGATVGQKRTLLYTLIGMFFNQTLPSTVGGDAARMWLLARHTGNWKSSVHSVIIDRAAGLIWLMLLVLLCLPWSLDMIREPVGRLALMLIGAGGVIVLIALYLLAHPGGAFLLRWRPTRYVAELAAAACSTILTVRVGAMIAGMSICVHVLAAFSAWCFAKSVGSALDLSQALFLVPPVILISAIPISVAGWGLREGAMVAAFAYAGLPEGDGFIVSLLIGASQFLIGAAGGLVWILSGDRERIGPIDSAAPTDG